MLPKRFLYVTLLVILSLGISAIPAQAQQDAPQLTIILEDDFELPALWAEVSGERYTTRFDGGAYEITNQLPRSLVTSVRVGPLANVFVETTASFPAAARGAAYGVTCRWQNANNFYAMLLDDSGLASIVRSAAGVVEVLADAELSGSPAGAQRVGALCIGTDLHLLLNGETVLSVRDFSFSAGSSGMVVRAGDSASAQVRFDRFLLAAVNRDLSETPVEFYPGIRAGERLYLVRPGDTLDEIAARFQVSTTEVLLRNPHILQPDRLHIWQPLAIPGGAAFPVALAVEPAPVIPQTGPPQLFFIHPPDLHPNVSVPFLHGDFDSPGAWQPGRGAEVEVEGDVYRLANAQENAWTVSLRPIDLPTVQVDAEARRLPGADGPYGLVCRYAEGSYYAFGIDAEGVPSIWLVQGEAVALLAQAGVTFNPGEYALIGASCYGTLLTLYIDGAVVAQAADATLASGYIGAVVGPGVSAAFTNLTAYLPTAALVE